MVQIKRRSGNQGLLLIRRLRRMWPYYIMIVPFLAFMIVFDYFPMYGVTLAFKDFKVLSGIMGSPWVGFKYFKQLFDAYSFWEVLRNTLIISLEKIVFCFPVPIILAIFINEIRNDKIKRTFQTFSYLPHFISWVIAASFVIDVFSLKGPVNYIIGALGGKSVYFMADVRYFRGLLIITDIWKGCGWGSIVYLAAITGIDVELYEAADIDGANKLQSIWHITLPGIRSTIITLFILKIGHLLSAGFDQIYNLYSSAVYSVADVLDTFTYRKGIIGTDYSYATAAGLFKNGIGFILVVLSNFVVRRLNDGEGGLW